MVSVNKRDNFKAKPQQKETDVIRVSPITRPSPRPPTRERSQIQGKFYLFIYFSLEKK